MNESVASVIPCFIDAADRLVEMGKLKQANYCYTQALQLAPDSVELNLKQGNVLQELEQLAEAIACYQKTVKLDPNFSSGYHCLGNVFRKQQKWSAAVAAYRQAKTLDPEFYWSHYHLGTALSHLNQWHEAIACYQEAIQLQPKFWEGYQALGDSQRKLKHYDDAIAAYQQAIALNPNFFWSHYNLGIVLLDNNNYGEAIASLQQAQAIDPNYPPLIAKLATALHFQGNFCLKEAEKYYQQALTHYPKRLELLLSALEITPANLQLCQKLGKLLIEQERFKLLIEKYRLTLQHTPEPDERELYGALHYDLGLAYLSQGQFTQAIASWQETLIYDELHLEANLQLASLMLKEGKLTEARQYYTRAIEISADSETREYCQYAIERLDNTSKRAKNYTEEILERSQIHVVLYTDCPQIYGAEQSSHILMKGLADVGYQVTCMQSLAENYLIEARNKLGIKHFWVNAENVDCIADYQNYDRPLLPATLYDASEAARSFARTKPDLIIFGDACIMSNLVPKQIAMHLHIPFVIVAHRVHLNARSQFAPYLDLLPPIYQQAQEVVVVSQNNLDLLHQEFGLEASKGKMIHNGISDRFFTKRNLDHRRRIRQELEIPLNAIVISTNARLDVEKGYQFQLQAIAQLQQREIWSQLYFVWSGLGGYSDRLKAEVERLNVGERVKFIGSRQDIPALLDAADIFLMPSLYEGMPVAIMEAMAKGVPVIATSVSGVPEELGNTGQLLADPSVDSQATVDLLVATIENWSTDRQLLAAKGQACQQRATELFREQRAISQYLHLVDRFFGLDLLENTT